MVYKTTLNENTRKRIEELSEWTGITSGAQIIQLAIQQLHNRESKRRRKAVER